MTGIDMPAVERRLSELDRYDVLDTSSEEAFDRITRLVCRLFDVTMSTVTFVDGHRQWFKSRQGLGLAETDRKVSICQLPIATGSALVVPDTTRDARFRDLPLVCAAPAIRFYAGVPIRSADGTAIGTLCAMDTKPRDFGSSDVDLLSDLARLVESELELRVQATTDPLTGSLSRRAFFGAAEQALALATRHRYDLACLVLDIDYFKQINDTFGHAVGDLVLRRLGSVCHERLRRSDIFGRLGGEEFGVILPHTGPSDCLKVAESLREAIAAQPFELGEDLRITASFGAATLEAGSTGVDALLERADQAMYQAKTAGRNCCRIWQGGLSDKLGLARRVLKAGAIVFNHGNSVIDCTVRRLSDLGARLDVVETDGVPRRFKLTIAADALSRACTVVGKGERQVEVVFE